MTTAPLYIIKEIPLADILFPQAEMRSGLEFEKLDELAQSIRTHGLIQPPTVRLKGDKYELICGYRRTKACEINGMVSIPCRVVESNENLADLQRAAENLFREDVNAVDEANYIKTLIDKHNYQLQDMATLLHKSIGYVSRRLKILEGPEMVRQALKDGKINLSIAEELMKVKSDDDRNRLLFLVINNGATVEVVRSWRVQSETKFTGVQPKTYDENNANADGTPHDPTKMGNLTDDRGPQVELNEQVNAFRVCHSCLVKTDEKDAKLLVLCPACAGAIAPYLGDISKQK